MARTPQLALSCTLMITPGGWALPKVAASNWGNFLLPMASAWSDVEASAESLVQQADPRNATTLLPDWLALFSPDPCGRNIEALPESQQQQYCYQRLTARGGQSIGYYVSLAAAVGETVTVQEGGWCRCGQARCGSSRLSAPGNQFNWRVTMAQAVVTKARCGSARCGDRLGSFTASLAQCPIDHASPAHTVVTFDYSGTQED